jgi:hypothetical protein
MDPDSKRSAGAAANTLGKLIVFLRGHRGHPFHSARRPQQFQKVTFWRGPQCDFLKLLRTPCPVEGLDPDSKRSAGASANTLGKLIVCLPGNRVHPFHSLPAVKTGLGSSFPRAKWVWDVNFLVLNTLSSSRNFVTSITPGPSSEGPFAAFVSPTPCQHSGPCCETSATADSASNATLEHSWPFTCQP